jgi:hypothetical protein
VVLRVMIEDLGFKFQGSWFRVHGLGLRGLEFGVWGLHLRV